MKNIMIDFPTQFETERLLIRMPIIGDGQAVYEAVVESLPELQPWLPFAQEEPNLENTEANIREAHAKFITREDLRLLVFLKETGELVASSGLHRIDWNVRKFEIGYWINTRFSGKGYMTEAVEGMKNFAITELNARRIEIRCDKLNVRSRAIPERLGFTLEGILRQDSLAVNGDTLRDTCVYSYIM